MKNALRLTVAVLGLAIFTLSVRGEDYTYETNNGTITITGYTGPGGAVTIPGTINGLPVTTIGDYAFAGTGGLTNVTIPDSVRSVGYLAFVECSSLTAINVATDNPAYGSADGVLFDKSQTTLIQYPEGKAGGYAVPNSVTTIGGGAFSRTSLTSITIPNSVTSIGDEAFSRCASLTSVYFQGNAPNCGYRVFLFSLTTKVYYLSGATGWGATFGGRPTIRLGPPELGVNLYAGLTVTGAVGTVYSIEYVTDLAQTNTPSAWRCLEYLQLPVSPYLWPDKSAPATGQRFYRAGVFTASTNMVFIPPGTFTMGSPTNEVDRFDREGPQTAVTLSRGFWLGKYEVTQGEYLAVMGSNPSLFYGDRTAAGGTNYGVDLSRPVETVSWEDATNYCAALTERERLAGRIATNSVYRLPTEAEWEYACRGWTSTRFSYGDDPGYTNLTNYAWYLDNSGGVTHPVGQKLANPWGLHDMHGNVWEWCQDWYGDYVGGMAIDPRGPDTGSYRVIRGGGWNFWWGIAGDCRSALRIGGSPDARGDDIGFRVVLAPGQ